jgi:hypothetical protein
MIFSVGTLEKKMTDFIKKQVSKTTTESLRESLEVTGLFFIFVVSILGVTP